MKNILLSVLFVLCNMPIFASHVVGGDISVQWVSANNYFIKVQVYRDDVNGTVDMPTDLDVGIYQIGTNIQQLLVTIPLTTSSIVTLGDDCYEPDPNVVRIEEGVYISAVFTLPNFSAGYYLQTQLYSRNDLSINLLIPEDYGMSFFAEIPDPALGQNSTPEFGSYPADAYLCVARSNVIDYSVSDTDGDSLVYSLVAPLSSSGTTNGTVAGAGAYPYYPTVPWNTGPGYNLANICGGTLPMQIDASTGILTAEPIVQSFFVFVVRVEEYRNGVKIGEIRRDVEYASLVCANFPPEFSIPTSVTLPVFTGINSEADGCVDLLITDVNGTGVDTFYLNVTSPNFDVLGSYVAPESSNGIFYYENFNNTTDTIWIPLVDSLNGMLIGLSEVPVRFCFVPICADIDSIYTLNVVAYLDGCSGLDSTEEAIDILVINNLPQSLNLSFPSMNSNLPQQVNFESLFCFDVSGSDNTGSGLLLNLKPLTANFDYIENHVLPEALGGAYYYTNFNGNDTLWLPDYQYNSTTGEIRSEKDIASRYCWNFDCDDLVINGFEIEYESFVSNCGDTYNEISSFHLDILPPEDDYFVGIANVFTPNNDDVNDYFKLRAYNLSDSTINAIDKCNDFINVTIYNRWGQLVYESEDPYFMWDGINKGGAECAEGVYVVIIKGTYGSTYHPTTREVIPNVVINEYTLQLFR